jgi:hypothetical protein
MNAEQQQDKLENYIAGLINESNAANIRIASLERLMREAQQVAHQFQEDNEYLRTELRRTKEEIHWLSHKDKSINVHWFQVEQLPILTLVLKFVELDLFHKLPFVPICCCHEALHLDVDPIV